MQFYSWQREAKKWVAIAKHQILVRKAWGQPGTMACLVGFCRRDTDENFLILFLNIHLGNSLLPEVFFIWNEKQNKRNGYDISLDDSFQWKTKVHYDKLKNVWIFSHVYNCFWKENTCDRKKEKIIQAGVPEFVFSHIFSLRAFISRHVRPLKQKSNMK